MRAPRTWRSNRRADFRRHLADAQGNSYEGASDRTDKERVFSRAVDLLAPVVERVLQAFSEEMLSNSGDIVDTGPFREEGGALAREWRLSWPGQQAARRRLPPEGPVQPIIIRAQFLADWTHGHLGGSAVGYWPLQILTVEDADRQEPILWAIAEAELHERIYDSLHPWEHVPVSPEDSR